MLEKLQELAVTFDKLTNLLASPEVLNDSTRLQEISKEQAKLAPVVEVYRKILSLQKQQEENQELVADKTENQEIRDMAKEELYEIKDSIKALEQEAQLLLLPSDPDDNKNTILEIRSGIGGDEASIFVGDLFQMYSRYAESQRWHCEIMNSQPSVAGGYKEISVLITGKKVYRQLKFESGTHRVQRVPQTETQGRVHTSAVTVAVLPEVQDIEIDINPADLRVDTYRSQGAGGQHVNTSDSAVRITHIPTNTVVSCQEERSQHKNKAKAMKYLQAKLYEVKQNEINSEASQARKLMVGSGDRSERIRTYNYPQGRITDHRINMTSYRLDEIVNTGNLQEFIDALLADHQLRLLQAVNTN